MGTLKVQVCQTASSCRGNHPIRNLTLANPEVAPVEQGTAGRYAERPLGKNWPNHRLRLQCSQCTQPCRPGISPPPVQPRLHRSGEGSRRDRDGEGWGSFNAVWDPISTRVSGTMASRWLPSSFGVTDRLESRRGSCSSACLNSTGDTVLSVK